METNTIRIFAKSTSKECFLALALFATTALLFSVLVPVGFVVLAAPLLFGIMLTIWNSIALRRLARSGTAHALEQIRATPNGIELVLSQITRDRRLVLFAAFFGIVSALCVTLPHNEFGIVGAVYLLLGALPAMGGFGRIGAGDALRAVAPEPGRTMLYRGVVEVLIVIGLWAGFLFLFLSSMSGMC